MKLRQEHNIIATDGERNGKYEAVRKKQIKEMIALIKAGEKIQYFRSFITIGNKTYNGWTEQQIKNLKII